MSFLAYALVLAVMVLPIAWLAAEFRYGRGTRISLGIAAMAVVAITASGLWSALSKLQYNSEFGAATKGLIEASIEQIEGGQQDRVLKAWRGLDAQYRPTYENRAQYPELAAEATALIRGEKTFAPGTPWDAGPFDRETWIGHWESDTGHWIVIGIGLNVYIAGDPPKKIEAAAMSDNFKTFTFREGSQWRHTLTLVGKVELTHEWFDLTRQEVWRTESMHKLIRPTNEK